MRQPPTPASQASPALAPATKPGPTPQGPNIHARASRLVLGLGLAAGLAAITGCNRNPATTASTGRNEPVPVTVATVTNAAWDRTVSIIGTLFPKDEAIIAARVEGQVEGTSVDFGDRVRNGQDIAAIDTTAYLAHLEQAVGIRARAEANLANARNNFDRVQRLQKSGIASDADFDLARSQLDQWQAEVKADAGAEAVARLNVDRSQVKAPFDGAVAERIVGRGDFVKVGSPLYRIVNDAVLKFIFQVPERHASLVEKRLPVSFNVDNYPGKTFTGSVYLISPSVSTASRSFGVGALAANWSSRKPSPPPSCPSTPSSASPASPASSSSTTKPPEAEPSSPAESATVSRRFSKASKPATASSSQARAGSPTARRSRSATPRWLGPLREQEQEQEQ
jgi:RND family efflux transporter MFP subunit